MIILRKWSGRLGNNIKQLSNIIDIAFYLKHNISFRCCNKKAVSHLFDFKQIEAHFQKYDNKTIIDDPSHYFYQNRIPVSKDIFNNKKYYQAKINLLKKTFLIKDSEIKKLDEDDIVIHIRGGDIFKESPHPKYIPPPLAFYTKILDKNTFKNIIIISQDKKNPVVDALLSKYKNAIYSKNSLEEDIKIILGSKNIIKSVGTFVSSLCLLSNNIENIYGSDFINDEFKNYYHFMKPWKNTKEQRNYILTYTY